MESTILFKQSKPYVFLIRNLFKVYLLLVVLFILLWLTPVSNPENEINLFGLIIVVIILGAFCLSLLLLFQNFLSEIVLDYKSRSIELKLCRSRKNVNLDFQEINDIRLNGYLVIVTEYRKYFYTHITPELLRSFSKVKKIRCGKISGLFSVSKKMLTDIEQELSNS